ncbi:hypothetical protein Clacol_005581 [Clathrus columnatus]|uniref:DNA-(apurinic or apyrimidinic site) endonuclease 2 n=1 Tax=Clathrus columnatus TaxID=1419009 RepID=A0AAV5AF74_9AGAM|nr:hypothetical protein Clacol_005581 [Clathrus columnatus]
MEDYLTYLRAKVLWNHFNTLSSSSELSDEALVALQRLLDQSIEELSSYLSGNTGKYAEAADFVTQDLGKEKKENCQNVAAVNSKLESIAHAYKEIIKLTKEFDELTLIALTKVLPTLDAKRRASYDLLAVTIEASLLKLSVLKGRLQSSLYGYVPPNPGSTTTIGELVEKLISRYSQREEKLLAQEKSLKSEIKEYKTILNSSKDGGFAQVVEDLARIKKETEDCKKDLRMEFELYHNTIQMKTQRNMLQKYFSLPKTYETFLSFPVNKGGYSGVAVYTKTCSIAPLKAEEGLTGILQPKPPLDIADRISPSYPRLSDLEIYPEDDGSKITNLNELELEGRALVLDFGLFVLINVYCPAETSETRLPYKMNYHLLLQERVRRLIQEENRQVIVAGDINITAAPIDHCDGNLPSNFAVFWERPPRAWFKNWLSPFGPMVDVVRKSWPERKEMYTCWNTRISARESNYGTRVDYILFTEGLLPWLKFGDIQPSVKGSDHCPVYVDLHDEIRLESGETFTLRDAIRYEQAKRRPPRIAARFWDEYKQRNLASFFMSKKNEHSSSESSPSTTPPEHTRNPPLETETVASVSLTSVACSRTSSDSRTVSQTTTKLHRKRSQDDDVVKVKKQKTGQAKISSFFKKDNGEASLSATSSGVQVINSSVDTRQIEEDRHLALQLSQSEDGLISTTAPSTTNSQSKSAWNELLAPIQPPKCDVHSEPCKEFTVNKPGLNKGKTFFLCSRPLGPGYDKGRAERLKSEERGPEDKAKPERVVNEGTCIRHLCGFYDFPIKFFQLCEINSDEISTRKS